MKKHSTLRAALISGVVLPSFFASSGMAIAQEARLDEIIVTARKRAESLQDTPVSVVAFSGVEIEERGLSNVSQIADSTPNLTFQTGASLGSATSASIFIRGIGQTDYALVVDPGVGLFIDGVYTSRSVGSVLDLIDIESIEVLRGPQGTLFGKNTIGGAVNVKSRRPAEEFGGYVEATAGNFNRVDVKGSIDIPLGETLRTRISAAKLTRDGFLERGGLPFIPSSNDISGGFSPNSITGFDGAATPDSNGAFLSEDDSALGDQNAFIGRVQADWDIASNFTASVDFDYTRKREGSAPRILTGLTPVPLGNFTFAPAGPGATLLGYQQFFNYQYSLPGETGAPRTAAQRIADQFNIAVTDIAPTAANPLYVDDGEARTSFQGVGSPNRSDLDVWGISLTLDWDLGNNVSAKSITAYRDVENTFTRDTDGTPFPINDSTNIFDSEQFTQEIQISGLSFDGRLNWIAGGFYSSETGEDINNLNLFPLFLNAGGSIDYESFALFAQGTFDLTDRLSVTGGLRWSEDDKAFSATPGGFDSGTSGIVGIGAFPLGSAPVVANTEAEETFEDLSPRVSISYEATDDLLVYGSYSSGYKSGGFNQRLAPGFQTIPTFDEETLDVFEAGFKFTGLNNRFRLNAAGFISNYDDLQLTGTQNFSPIIENAAAASINGIEAEFTWLVTDYFTLDGGYGYLDASYDEFDATVATDAGGAQSSSASRLALAGVTVDDELSNAPEHSFNLGAEFVHNFLEGEMKWRGDLSYRSEIALDAPNFLIEDDLTLLHASVNFIPKDSDWRITAAVRNLTDERYNVSGFADPNGVGILSAQPARPREWSVTVRRSF